MNTTNHQGASEASQRDYGFIAIATLVTGVAMWLLLMPWVPAISSATMHRFHLRSSSFASWAIQQPIPPMYNFANRVQVDEMPPGMVDPVLNMENESRYINHFPARVFTFANRRYLHLVAGSDRWLTIESSYRGQKLESLMHAKPNTDGHGFTLIRLPTSETSE